MEDVQWIIVAIVTSDFGTISSLIDQVRYPADSLTTPRVSAHKYPLLTSANGAAFSIPLSLPPSCCPAACSYTCAAVSVD